MRLTQRVDYDFLAQSEAFTQFSDMMLELTGMSVALFPQEGNRFTMRASGEAQNPICRMIQSHPEGLRKCLECNRVSFNQVASTRAPAVYTCHIGQTDIAIPVFHQGECVAIISTGQLLPEPPSEEGFKQFEPLCDRFGLDCLELQRSYQQAFYLPPSKIRATIALLTFFAQHLCESSQRIYDLTVSQYPEVVLRAKTYVDEHLREDLSLALVAERSGFSPGYLSKKWLESLGLSFTEYVQSERISRAKTFLRETVKPISMIALECGFGSLSQFNRAFAKSEGQSPRTYRRS